MTTPTPIAAKQPQPKRHVRDQEVNPFLESLPITAECVAGQAEAARDDQSDSAMRSALVAEITRLRGQRDALAVALAQSMLAIDDWLNIYASDQCKPKRVHEARDRINEVGTLAYIARVQKINRDALAKAPPASEPGPWKSPL